MIESVAINNNPCLGFVYTITIHRNGIVNYRNHDDCKDGALLFINPDKADRIIDFVITSVNLFDRGNYGHGCPIVDGHHWKVEFKSQNGTVDIIEGWTDEPPLRYLSVKHILEYVERNISKNLGTEYMCS